MLAHMLMQDSCSQNRAALKAVEKSVPHLKLTQFKPLLISPNPLHPKPLYDSRRTLILRLKKSAKQSNKTMIERLT